MEDAVIYAYAIERGSHIVVRRETTNLARRERFVNTNLLPFSRNRSSIWRSTSRRTLHATTTTSTTIQHASCTDVFAQALPSTGADAWISQMRRQDLFQAHLNDCDTSTEAFISVGATNRGFCIEKAERTAASWLDARETCLAAEKRLPEPAEFQSACNQAATLSLSNMTDDWEWASNFARDFAFESTYRYGVGTPRMGNPGCNRGSIGWIATTDIHRKSASPKGLFGEVVGHQQ